MLRLLEEVESMTGESKMKKNTEAIDSRDLESNVGVAWCLPNTQNRHHVSFGMGGGDRPQTVEALPQIIHEIAREKIPLC